MHAAACRPGPLFSFVVSRIPFLVGARVQYISFYSLRQCDMLASGALITDQVYVHGKVLIVDDRIALIGSGNINDRSLTPQRDSEACVVVDGGPTVASRMNGVAWQANSFAHTLRMRLWHEHLGLLDPGAPAVDVTDPVHPSTFISVWRHTALSNTAFYEANFPSTIQFTDLAHTKTLEEPVAPAPPGGTVAVANAGTVANPLATTGTTAGPAAGAAAAPSESAAPAAPRKRIPVPPAPAVPQGHLVWFSYELLGGQELSPKAFSKEALLPPAVFQ